MTPEKKPVESHSNDFFPVGSLYCISLLRLDQVKEKLEKGHFGMLPSMRTDHFKIVEPSFPTFAQHPFTWKSTHIYAHMQNYPLRTGHFKSEIPE